ncbi:cysteine desulfurase family protein [Altericroceibacterium xinjiangense]|uniref:cysteine desulfurase family protein n=1 Tax=Altericroceibacterium xinjiangense TaxID=762261 RepID=UPI003B979016
MARGFALWANPSSPHAEGRAARHAFEDARARVKAALDWDGEVIFTSGASEAAAIALGQSRGEGRLVSAVEHEAVLRAAPTARILPVRGDGAVDVSAAEQALADAQKPLVAVQTVNSETGNRQDVPAIAELVRGVGGLLVCDASQGAGKLPLPGEADMAIISAHKLGGPVGIGALLVRDYAMLAPTGGQERGYRRGTESLPGALGFAAALEACDDPYLDPSVLEPLEAFVGEVRAMGGEWLSDRLADPTPFIRAIAMPHLSGAAQLMRFDMAGHAVSQGSACSSGSLRTSHVLEAMNVEPDTASRTIRVSFGWTTTRADVERFCEAWLAMARKAQDQAA